MRLFLLMIFLSLSITVTAQDEKNDEGGSSEFFDKTDTVFSFESTKVDTFILATDIKKVAIPHRSDTAKLVFVNYKSIILEKFTVTNVTSGIETEIVKIKYLSDDFPATQKVAVLTSEHLKKVQGFKNILDSNHPPKEIRYKVTEKFIIGRYQRGAQTVHYISIEGIEYYFYDLESFAIALSHFY